MYFLTYGRMAPFNYGQGCRETRKYHLSCCAGYSGYNSIPQLRRLAGCRRQAAGRHSLQWDSAWIRKPTLIVIAVADQLGSGWWLIVIVAFMVLLDRHYQYERTVVTTEINGGKF